MERARAIEILQSRAAEAQGLGATALYLFGSTARDQAAEGSDVDLFVDYDPGKKFSLVDLVDIKLLLEQELGIEVDVTTRDSLHPMLRNEIERTAVRVF